MNSTQMQRLMVTARHLTSAGQPQPAVTQQQCTGGHVTDGRPPTRGSLSAAQREHYEKHGWLVVEGALTDADFAGLERAYTDLICAQAARWLQEGKIRSTHSELPFSRQLGAIASELSDDVYTTEMSAFIHRLDAARLEMPEALEFFFTPALLDAVESIIGPEISFNPIVRVSCRGYAAAACSRRCRWLAQSETYI